MKLRRLSLILLLLFLPACSQAEQEEADADTPPELTRQQRDSAIAELPIPGAQGVRGALDAAAAAGARAQTHDTIR
ncbi:MAG: hypothetical protein WEA09_03535 [Gemmatimonadota bacterium]